MVAIKVEPKGSLEAVGRVDTTPALTLLRALFAVFNHAAVVVAVLLVMDVLIHTSSTT